MSKKEKQPKAPLTREERKRCRNSIIRTVLTGLVCIAVLAGLAWAVQYTLEQDRLRALEGEGMKKESPIVSNRRRDYGEAGFRQVAENEYLVLCADFTNGEVSVMQKDTGVTWYTNPQNRNDKGIQGVKSRLQSQLIYTAYNVNTTRTATYDSFSQCVRMGGLDHEVTENGVIFRYSFPTTGIIIPLQYRLVGDSLEVSVPHEYLDETWGEEWVCQSIEVLPFFGASTEADEGYILAPDGSGALIALNSDKYVYNAYSSDQIYGLEQAYGDVVAATRREQVIMPVYGMKVNDTAFLAVITEGAGTGKVQTYLSRKATSYNQAYSTTTLRESRIKSVAVGTNGGMNFEDGDSHGKDYTACLIAGGAYTTRFYFLNGEDADYAGMSECYRNHLNSVGEMHTSDLVEKQYTILDVYGAVSLTEIVMGVQREVITELTSYNELCDIVRALKAAGVDNLIINYIGALKGGLETTMLETAKHEPALGSQKEFTAMLACMEEQGVILFFQAEPAQMFKEGNGYNKQDDAIRSFFDGTPKTKVYSPSNVKNARTRKNAWMLQQEIVPAVMEKFAASAKKLGIENIALNTLGEMAYLNLDKENFVSRDDTISYWAEAAENTRKYADHILVHVGNAYSAAWADVITDIAPGASDFDVQDGGIPFYQMTMHGQVVLGTQAINESADYQLAFLNAIESGSSLKYSIMAEENTRLVGTAYTDMVSCSWDHWVDTICEQYRQMQTAIGDLGSVTIEAHEWLANGVTKTTYANGVSVIVNYNEEAHQHEGLTVDGRSFVRMEVQK